MTSPGHRREIPKNPSSTPGRTEHSNNFLPLDGGRIKEG